MAEAMDDQPEPNRDANRRPFSFGHARPEKHRSCPAAAHGLRRHPADRRDRMRYYVWTIFALGGTAAVVMAVLVAGALALARRRPQILPIRGKPTHLLRGRGRVRRGG
jgi:hypothetical protein